MWKLIAKIVSSDRVSLWLIERSFKRPYTHLTGYMERWWLFNPYPAFTSGQTRRFEWLPSVRIHHILREDLDRALHDHPWNARTIILKGWYVEVKEDGEFITRLKGDTASLHFGEFHTIKRVSEGGVWTLFITWRYRGTWGFKVDGKKVPWQEYLNVK